MWKHTSEKLLSCGGEECFDTHLSRSDSPITSWWISFVLLLHMETQHLPKASRTGSCWWNPPWTQSTLAHLFCMRPASEDEQKSMLMTVTWAQFNKSALGQKPRTEVIPGQNSYWNQHDKSEAGTRRMLLLHGTAKLLVTDCARK